MTRNTTGRFYFNKRANRFFVPSRKKMAVGFLFWATRGKDRKHSQIQPSQNVCKGKAKEGNEFGLMDDVALLISCLFVYPRSRPKPKLHSEVLGEHHSCLFPR